MKAPLKAVIFDIGGVLAYDVWEHLYFDDTGLATHYRLSKDKLTEVGKKIWAEYAYVSTLGRSSHELEREHWEHFIFEFASELPASVSVETLIEFSEPFVRGINDEKIIPLLEELSARSVPLALCSNNNEFWFERQAQKAGFGRFFSEELSVLSCRLGVSKSDPSGKMFTEVLARLGLRGDETLYFDDREHNLEIARVYGIHAVLVPPESVGGADRMRAALVEHGILSTKPNTETET